MPYRHFFYSNSWISDTLEKKATYVSPPSPPVTSAFGIFQILLLNLHIKLCNVYGKILEFDLWVQ